MLAFFWPFSMTLLWLVLFLGWSCLCFRAGYWARGDEELSNLLHKIIPPRDDNDDGPGGVRVPRR
jgi:hypothetical protein